MAPIVENKPCDQWRRKFAKSGGAILLERKYFYGKILKSNGAKSLENIILSFPNDIIWIAGDFNLPDIDWNISCIAGSNYPLKINELFLDFTNTFGFSQLVNFPTRYNNILA